jgi:RNA recognition motif-containing protein
MSSSNVGAQGRRVFVGNLSYQTRWPALKDHMAQAGTVVRADVLVMSNGRSKGCGLVEFETREQAMNAIASLTDSELDGRAIFVREDREAEASGPAPSRPPRVESVAPAPSAPAPTAASSSPVRETRACFKCGQMGHLAAACPHEETELEGRKLFVSNLAYSISWQDLKDLFAEYGPVTRADVFQERPGRSKGVGVVVMGSSEDAIRAMTGLNGRDVRGRVLTVREDRQPGNR